METCSECGAEMPEAAQVVHDMMTTPPQVTWQICAACVRPGESMIQRAEAWRRTRQANAVSYVIVLRDHAGAWHGVDIGHTWDEAWAIHHGALGALRIIDYYPDYPSDVLKIIASYPGQLLDYERAPALDGPK